MEKRSVNKLVLSAMFLCIALLLPFLTGQIPQIGKMLLPMHLPVILCGLICGWQYGMTAGFIAPVLRGIIFANPVLFPTGAIMAFELAAYGAFAGIIYNMFKKQNPAKLYITLISTMLAGRIVKCIFQFLILGFTDEGFVFTAFFAGAFTNAIPGIILQLILIPIIMITLDKTGLVPFKRRGV